ncbi:signal peptidase I [Shewanella sp. OPT22]|nr:signal peptidase I [Shewanella sp. OPT22]
MKRWLIKSLKENKSLLLFLVLMSVFRSAVADWYTVPTGSMKPTILEGDRIYTNKMAYDVRVPFTHISLYKVSNPTRGDIIVFDSKAAKNRLIKRVIGIPGDRVVLSHNQLTINGEQLDYQKISSNAVSSDEIENLLGLKHQVRLSETPSSLASFREVTVPEGHYLALGDNRDHSADSRVIGFVPRSEIIGSAESVVMSLNYDNYYLPRKERFFHSLFNG